MNTVLIIESDKATRNALHDLLLLEWPHLRIFTASSGQEGLKIAKLTKIDLVIFEGNNLSNKNLPGDVLARQLRQIPSMGEIPFIAVAVPQFRNQKDTVELRPFCNAWLLKPFSAERLIRVVSPFTYRYS